MSTTARPRSLPLSPTADSRPTRGPVFWLSILGGSVVALQLYVYISWIASSDFRKIPTGADPLPASQKVWAVVLQASVTLLAVGCVVWVVRQCRREHRLTFDAMLLIGWVSCFWLDPVPNLIRPQVFFNSYYVNMGSWVEHIPGWFGPTGANLPNSLLLEGSAFFTNILGSVIACKVMGPAQRRFKLRNFSTYLVGVGVCMAFFLVMEEVMIQAGWLAWPGTIHALSLQPNTVHQMPLTEMVLCGFFLGGAMAALRYFKDDQGRSFAERGIDKLTFSGPRNGAIFKRAVALLAVIGFCNAAWLTYNAFTVPLSLYVDTMPKGFPSYLTNDMCGTAQIKLCPDKNAPFAGPHTAGINNVPGVDTSK